LKDSKVAVDSSFLLKIFLPEENSKEAEKLWLQWIEDSIEVVAPALIVFEASSVLRNNAFRGVITEDVADTLIVHLKELDIRLVYTDDLLLEAWELGKLLKSPSLYDCFYLALSRFLDIPLWTADRKLYNASKGFIPAINLL
jgi:predicted nucleic acid-binding protein